MTPEEDMRWTQHEKKLYERRQRRNRWLGIWLEWRDFIITAVVVLIGIVSIAVLLSILEP